MRRLEALLWIANLVTFFAVLALPRVTVRWTRFLAIVAMLIGVAQVLMEGPRWQLVPTYTLTVLVVLISMRAVGASAGRNRFAISLGALGLVIALALPTIFPVFRFAQPNGPYGIGTLTYHWTDAARSEVFVADPKQRRQLMVQVWYPAKARLPAARVPYIADNHAVMAAFAHIHGLPAFAFGHFRYITTNAVSNAPAAGDQVRYPVLLFLEGATGFRQMNTYQVEHLVSHGYIVVAMDQPGAAATVVFPDGHPTAGLTLAQFQTAVRPSYLPIQQDPVQRRLTLPTGRTLPDSSIVPYLAQDVIFALNQLEALNLSDPNGILTGILALDQVGAFGLSLGGIVVGESCRLDPRIRACLMMDAPLTRDVVKAGLQQPGMWITRDVASMRLERQRAGGWPEMEIEAHQTSMRAAYDSSSGAGYFVQVPGMFHSNFTDIPAWTPLASWAGLAGPINAMRAHEIINACSLAFFDRHLRGSSAELMDGAAAHYPEVILESHRR